jgi:hypothetical protein
VFNYIIISPHPRPLPIFYEYRRGEKMARFICIFPLAKFEKFGEGLRGEA